MPDTFVSEASRRLSSLSGETRSERLRRQRRLSMQRWARAFFYDVLTLFREARVPLIGFFVVLAAGTLYWTLVHTGHDYTLGEALFETTRMLVFEHSEAFPDDLLGQVLFFAVPGFGLAFVFQGVLDFGRLLLDKGGRLEGWQISLARTYSDHIVLCGLGRVSYRIMLQLLEAGYEVIIIERDWESEFVEDTLALRVPVIHGDARAGKVLRQAGIYQAAGLITCISNDLLNIEVALAARRMRKNLHVVLRIFNEQLDENLERSQFGRNTAFSSSALAAPTLAAAAVCRGIKYALPLPEAFLGVSEIVVTAGSKLDNMVYKIEQEFQVQIICYTGETATGEMCWRHRLNPTTRLYGGDRLLVVGTLPALGNLWRHGHTSNRIMGMLGMALAERISPEHNRVIVCGLGRVGYRVVRALHRMSPRPEIVVICNAESTRERFIKEIRGLGIKVIVGDARSEETLREAGIERAYSVALVTSDNLTNLRVSLAARQIRSNIHVVLRVFSDVLAEQLEEMFGVRTSFSTSALSAPTMAAAVVVKNTAYALDVGEKLLSTARMQVCKGGLLDGQAPALLRERYAITVLAVTRHNQLYLLPRNPERPDLIWIGPLQPGDDVVLLAEIHTIGRLRSLGAETTIADEIIGGRSVPTAAPAGLPAHNGHMTDTVPAHNLAEAQNNSPNDSQTLLEQLLQQAPTESTPKTARGSPPSKLSQEPHQ